MRTLWVSAPQMRAGALLAGIATWLALAGAADARQPVIAYLDAANKLALYDSETGAAVTAPNITVPNSRYFAVSANGRFIFYRDAQKKLHLYDRDVDAERSLPGIDVFANPDRPSVSNAGLLAFDGGDMQARVYDSSTGAFVSTGFAADSGHRQTVLSADGKLLATTCISGSSKCIGEASNDGDSDSNLFVQDLTTRLDTALPDLAGATDKDLEHPCINGDGSLVGADVFGKDLVLYDRTTHTDVTDAALKTTTAIEVNCVLSAGGRYVGLDDNAGHLKLYDRTTAQFIALPATVTAHAWFTSPYQKPAPPVTPPTTTPPPIADLLPPVLSKLSAKPRRFRPRGAGGHGTVLRFTLSEAASVRVRILRRSRVLATYVKAGAPGANRLRLSGRVGRRRHTRPLAPGAYKVRIVATDAAGNKAAPVTVKVRVLP
ncbi:MAG: hypothetical protein QOF37_293 [Thermoleophilaceae bacterium]|nr:hypothetical protein [Thermoleophilaceae bacterium]